MAAGGEPDYSRISSLRSLIVAGSNDSHTSPSTNEALALSLGGSTLSITEEGLRSFVRYGIERMKEKLWQQEAKVVTMEGG